MLRRRPVIRFHDASADAAADEANARPAPWSLARKAALGALFALPVGVIAVDAAIIVKKLRPATETRVQADVPAAAVATGDEADGSTPPLSKRGRRTEPEPEESDAPLDDLVGAPDPPPDRSRPKKRAAAGTVEEAASRGCSTSSVDALSRQIIAEGRCIDPHAFVPVPKRANLIVDGNVFLHMDAAAKDRLLEVLDKNKGKTLRVHSALRTVAQQFLLHRWAANRRCGIQLATPPGESNHETGLALDVSEPGTWRPALEEAGFKWLGKIDRVHFDFKGAAPHNRVDVLAFQRLWNKNHPEDAIAETGRYDAATDARLRKAPAGGFPRGGSCEAPRAGVAAGASRASAR